MPIDTVDSIATGHGAGYIPDPDADAPMRDEE
jgi:hypothetical protein